MQEVNNKIQAIKTHKQWTQGEIDIIASGKYSTRELVKLLGRSKSGINQKKRKILLGEPVLKPRMLYGIINPKTDETLFVGTMDEISAYTGKDNVAICSAIRNAEKMGYRCKYVRIGWDNED